jgi:hypothetical protein
MEIPNPNFEIPNNIKLSKFQCYIIGLGQPATRNEFFPSFHHSNIPFFQPRPATRNMSYPVLNTGNNFSEFSSPRVREKHHTLPNSARHATRHAWRTLKKAGPFLILLFRRKSTTWRCLFCSHYHAEAKLCQEECEVCDKRLLRGFSVQAHCTRSLACFFLLNKNARAFEAIVQDPVLALRLDVRPLLGLLCRRTS